MIDWLHTAERTDHRLIVITAGRQPAAFLCWLEQRVVHAVVHKLFNIEQLLTLIHQVAQAEAS